MSDNTNSEVEAEVSGLATASVINELKRLGFQVLSTSPGGVSISGPKELYEEAFDAHILSRNQENSEGQVLSEEIPKRIKETFRPRECKGR